MKEMLTLKKEETKQKIIKDKKTNDVFKAIKITPCGGMTIGIAQSSFENFWHQLNKIDASKYEKERCLDKLKEACSWISRGIAKYHRDEE